MKHIEIFNNTMVILSLAVNIFFLVPLLCRIYKYFTQKRYIKRVLAYNSNEPVQIYQSTYTYNTIEGFVYDYITYNSLECMDNILSIFNIINSNFALE